MSTSLWGRELKDWSAAQWPAESRRPPCEVVNWKNPVKHHMTEYMVDLLVRSWIERYDILHRHPTTLVDLLVRSWIERLLPLQLLILSRSTSLWGRELKGLWWWQSNTGWWSTSLWGRELKAYLTVRQLIQFRRPPCEVVNWKTALVPFMTGDCSRPPCEVVNWKIHGITSFRPGR